MLRLVIASALILCANSAVAQNSPFVAKEITQYRDIHVAVLGKAKDCYITDPAVFADRANTKLGEIGIKQNPDSLVSVAVQIAGQPFGVLGQVCAYAVSLDFGTRLTAENIKTDNPQVRAAIDRLKDFPIALWTESTFGVTTLTEPGNVSGGQRSQKAEEAALQAVDSLVARFAEFRK